MPPTRGRRRFMQPTIVELAITPLTAPLSPTSSSAQIGPHINTPAKRFSPTDLSRKIKMLTIVCSCPLERRNVSLFVKLKTKINQNKNAYCCLA